MNSGSAMSMMATMSPAEMQNDMTGNQMMAEAMMERKMAEIMPVMQPVEIYERFALALNDNNLAGVMQLFDANGATVPYPGQPAVAGREAVQGVMAQCLAMQPQIHYDDSSVIMAEDVALLRSSWRLKVTGMDGKPVEVMGKGIQVARRQSDGSWRILIDNPWCAE